LIGNSLEAMPMKRTLNSTGAKKVDRTVEVLFISWNSLDVLLMLWSHNVLLLLKVRHNMSDKAKWIPSWALLTLTIVFPCMAWHAKERAWNKKKKSLLLCYSKSNTNSL
jgi:hypothetical protein